MCGIIAYLGSSNGMPLILSGLNLLQNRGYDSAGVSYIETKESNDLIVRKFASTDNHDSLAKLKESIQHVDSPLIIGHTRWATHGRKTDMNAHPHQDNQCRISIVHNGIIENYYELKQELLAENYVFHSQTDTEVISILIGKYLDENCTIETAIENTVLRLKGTWALVIVHVDFPNKVWITRNGSPLLLGMDDEYVMVASEHVAFGNHINKYILLNNDDIIEITREGSLIKYNKDIHRYAINHKKHVHVELQPTGYDHWMIKEIFEQPDCIMRAMNNGGRIKSDISVKLGGLDSKRAQLMKIDHLILLGCGTSYYAGLWSSSLFKNMKIFSSVSVYDGADFNNRDIPIGGVTGLLLLSQSGETKDLHRCIQIAKKSDLITIGVINVVDSFIARETDCGVYLNAGRENAVASTKSFTNQCVVLAMISVWFSQIHRIHTKTRRKIIADLRNLPLQITKLLDDAQPITISNMCGAKSMFILGKGSTHSIALESALKIKEVTYIHAEGYSTSALKHGPFALIEKDTPIFFLDIDEEHHDKTYNAMQEVLAREAHIITLTSNKHIGALQGSVNVFHIEENTTFGGLLANCFMQVLSYHMSVSLGYNPDYPRNLAKVVTVE